MAEKAIVMGNEVVCLPVDAIKPNPYQPRKFFERANLEELSRSIRLYGVMQPVTVRLINGCSYELVAGERRLRACKMAGVQSIPAVVVNISDRESAILALIENLQREDLNFLEEAEGLYNLMKDYSFTQEQLAEKIGKSQSAVANKLRVLRLSDAVKAVLVDNELTERHARALLRLESENAQMTALNQVVRDGMTVKRTEELVERMLKPVKRGARPKIKRFIRDVKIFTNTINRAVDILKGSGIEAECRVAENEKGCDIQIKVVY